MNKTFFRQKDSRHSVRKIMGIGPLLALALMAMTSAKAHAGMSEAVNCLEISKADAARMAETLPDERLKALSEICDGQTKLLRSLADEETDPYRRAKLILAFARTQNVSVTFTLEVARRIGARASSR